MNYKLTIALLLGFSIIYSSKVCSAQQGALITTSDLELWSAAKVNYQANEKFSIGLEQQLRLKTDWAEVDQYFTELNIKKEIGTSFYYNIGLRFIRSNESDGVVQAYENNFRYNIDLGYKHRLNQFKLNYRVRYQRRNEWGVTKAEGDEARNHIRLRVGGDYKIKNWKLDPAFSTELFYNPEQGEGFDKIRFTLGTKYNIKNVGAFVPFYRLERELDTSYPKTTYILGLQFIYNIKRKKSNDK